MQIAKTATQAYNACNPDISIDAGDERYVDLNTSRGFPRPGGIASDIAWRIGQAGKQYCTQLVTGHRGCGKTTELLQLKARLERQRFLVIYEDIDDTLDLAEVTYHDILLAIANAIEKTLRSKNISISKSFSEDLEKWFAEKVIKSNKYLEYSLEGSVGGSIEAQIPTLAKVLASITGRIKGGGESRVEIRQTLDREISVFIQQLNAMIIAARTAVLAAGYVDFVIIVDSLERISLRRSNDKQSDRNNHTELFIENADRLKSPQCHIVYTAPISLLYNTNLGNSYTDGLQLIPMVDVKKATGHSKMIEMVKKRIDTAALFEKPELLDELITFSGGAVRDVMRLIRFASEQLDTKITANEISIAKRALMNEFEYMLRDEDIPTLIQAHQNRDISGNDQAARLLFYRLIHEYRNGERWVDVHPAVLAIRRVTRALAEHIHPN